MFAERGAIDFTGIAQAAVAALGEPDDPTDLLLALDVRLRHLLVDEFQDTSRSHWELDVRLTAGWVEGDGRTVFLVGDPMQSIYRFREADVALFLRARESGLPDVPLTGVRLATNFRSRGGIVAWVNEAFARVLPAREDADSGAVPYAASSARHPTDATPAVRWHPFVGSEAHGTREAEARTVARLARTALDADPGASVAILVRFRSHLDRIVPALRQARVRFRAVDIEPLGARPAIQDLLAITRALAHPADRVAWLALLRAPWCALTAAELHLLVEAADLFDEPHATIWELIGGEARLERLERDARERVRRLRERLAPWVAGRLRGTLRERVEGAWPALGARRGCAWARADLEDAETFFDQLDQLERAGDIADPAVLEEHLGELFGGAPDMDAAARLQVMTIHKAVGPGVRHGDRAGARPGAARRRQAALRMEGARGRHGDDGAGARRRRNARGGLRLPVRAGRGGGRARGGAPALRRGHARGARAAPAGMRGHGGARGSRARAPSRPALPARQGVKYGRPASSQRGAGALARDEVVPHGRREAGAGRARRPRAEGARRLACRRFAARASAAASDGKISIEFSWAGETARHVGIVTHRWLQRITAADGVQAWRNAACAWTRRSGPRRSKRTSRAAASRPLERGSAGATRAWPPSQARSTDPRGRWVLEAHPQARSEHRLRLATPAGVKAGGDRPHLRRCRRASAGSSTTRPAHQGAEAERFLDSELERYRPQLAGYAAAVPGRIHGARPRTSRS